MLKKIRKYLGKINFIEQASKNISENISDLRERIETLEKINSVEQKIVGLNDEVIRAESILKSFNEKLDKLGYVNEIYKVSQGCLNVDCNDRNQNYFVAAIPDSTNWFDMYPEFKDLYSLFIGKNTDNNVRDFSRFYSFVLNINQVLRTTTKGAFAELGVYKGTNAAVMARYCRKINRRLYLFDTFEGFDKRDLVGIDRDQSTQFADTSLNEVKRYVGEGEFVHYIKGFFPDSVTEEVAGEVFAFVSLDCDLYAPIKSGLEFFWPRLVKTGMIFVHDYRSGFFDGCSNAVDEFCKDNDVFPVLLPDKSGTAVLIKI